MNKFLGYCITVGALALSATAVQAETLVLEGPALPNHNLGWPSTGLQLTALQDVTLNSFVFNTYGRQDTIELLDTNNNILQSYHFAATNTESAVVINANWALNAGTTYRLISLDPDNSKWENGQFPAQNAHIRVDGGYGFGQVQPYWFHFTSITTTNAAPVPEPETYAMMLAGIAALGLMARRRKV